MYNSFWKIISNNEIVIPTIQRDYAYGRKEASNILINILTSIKDVLDNIKEKQLHLAFVYGKLEGKQNDQLLLRNSENIKALLQSVKEYANNLDIQVNFNTARDVVRIADNVKFIPIDGQQRLTTLYLLHWYFALHLKEYNDLEILKKFQYATRTSSKEFCELICSIKNEMVNSEINSDFIINQEGYFKQWYNDPTVKNMLIVINQINNIFKIDSDKFSSYYEKLKNTDTVCFDFFDLDNFQQTDDLYVKMNSRGKKLTQFENFKAWLYHEKDIDPETKKKIDINWYDLFWQVQHKEPSEIDTAYLQWFKNLALPDFLKERNEKNSSELIDNIEFEQYKNANLSATEETKSIIGILRKSDSKFLDFLIGNKDFKIQFLNNIENYLNVLRIISDNYKHQLSININPKFFEGTIEELLFAEQNNLNWWQVTLQYAVVKYAVKYNYDETEFKNYLRVISNLIFNTAIDSPSDYVKAIKSIDTIVDECNQNILSYFNEKEISEIAFYNNTQKEEEKEKANLCLDEITGSNWQNAIVDAEIHPYFYGQIGFILKLFKSNKINLNDFKLKYSRIANIFSKEVLLKPNNYLFRALATIIGKELFIIDGQTLRYPINDEVRLRSRNENWRRCLLDKNKIELISNLLLRDEFDNIETTVEYFNKIINDYSDIDNFLYRIIKNEFLLNKAPKQCLYDYNEDEKLIYLLNTTSLRGYYRELLTTDWFLENEFKFANDDLITISVIDLQHDIDDVPGLKIENKVSNRNYWLSKSESEIEYELYEIENNIKGQIIKKDRSIESLIEYIKIQINNAK